jgi:predicted dienelactone hydrolase
VPDGQIFHAAGPSAGGWTVMAVHDSKESWERFRDSILMPTMQRGIEGGFQPPPHETVFDVHKLMP